MEPTITLEQGKLKGRTEVDYGGRTFYSFQNIPYAKPPLGNLRFKAPQPPEPWTGLRDATTEPNECYSHHMITTKLVGGEDCLYLNVYTPKLPSAVDASSFPVMFWVHGGAFIEGSSRREFFSPEFLVMHDVILVTVNYRLGLLGFLSLDEPSLEVPGNAAFKDLVMALQWVQLNISKFSGNPKNVTVFGESAGGAAVEYLTLSPLTKDLFHRAILHSGSALNYWACGKSSVEVLGKALEANTNNAREILKLLTEIPVEKLLEVQEKLPESFCPAAMRPLGPVVEKAGTPGAFLTEHPLKILKSGNYNKIPLLFLYTKEEGMLMELFRKRINVPPIHTNFEDYIPQDFKVTKNSDESKTVAESIKQFYYRDKQPSLDTKPEFYNLESDCLFLKNIYDSIRIRSATSDQPIYFCRFSVDAGLNFLKTFFNFTHVPGTCHADELGYLFKCSFTPPNIPPNSTEDKAIRRLTKLWTNFAKYSSPTAEKDALTDIEWKPVEAEKLHFLDFGQELTVGINPDFDRISFWDNLYEKYNGPTSV